MIEYRVVTRPESFGGNKEADDGVHVSWSYSGGDIASYELQMRCGLNGEWEEVGLVGEGLVFCASVSGLDHEYPYYFRVRARFDSGVAGEWSSPVLELPGTGDGIRGFKVAGDAIAVAGELCSGDSDGVRVIECKLEEEDGSEGTYYNVQRGGAELMGDGSFLDLEYPNADKVVWERAS